MKKIIYLTFVCFTIMSLGNSHFNLIAYDVHAQTQTQPPPYAKWGNIAVEKTKEKYPDAQVVDYLHVGKENKGNNSVEKFKLWVKGKDREFGVLVNIEFNRSTEKIVRISFKEVAR
ncbi:YqzG/YhdC family protein [Niallia sp. Krafla_26]|uniref:YqzG/YhdC family protein n=1 Tax=Niallia sp. Krafla_26 TaxID=3064703 RepID=UPI003D1734C1